MRLGRLPFVKICCISSREEARLGVAAGASALGLVSSMPSGPGQVDDQLVAQIAAVVPPPVATFLLTCKRDAAGIVEQYRVCRTTSLQLVDRVPPDELRRIRVALPAIKIVQAIHVTGHESVEEAKAVSGFIDALFGGISAANAEKAILAVQPFGLDLCSSVRSDGILDESKLKAFFSALWSMQSGQPIF